MDTSKDMNTAIIAGVVLLVLALAYYFLVYKKKGGAVSTTVPQANSDGKTIDKTPEGFPIIPDPASATPEQRKIVDDYRTGLENFM